MDKEKRKALIKEYKMTPRPVGVYLIRNEENGRLFVGGSLNVQAMMNRHQLQLSVGSHPNERLQEDWNTFGAEAFTFEVLECLDPSDDLSHDYTDDLAALEELWLEKIQPYGESGYNTGKA